MSTCQHLALTHQKCARSGVVDSSRSARIARATPLEHGVPVDLGDGTNDEPAAGSDQDDRARYKPAGRVEKGTILDELWRRGTGRRPGRQGVILDEWCATTVRHRDHPRQALREALGPRQVPVPRKARTPT